jgi:peptidyl-prolyl cis-trans isomerase SurA
MDVRHAIWGSAFALLLAGAAPVAGSPTDEASAERTAETPAGAEPGSEGPADGMGSPDSAPEGEGDAQLIDGIAAQVGSDIVLISDVRNLAGPMELRVRAAGGGESDIAQLRADALERLIERALVREVVRRSELEATEIELDTAIGAIASENNLTIGQLIATVEAEGLPFAVYRERIRGEIEQTKVVNGMVASRVTVEEAEVLALYQERYQDQPSGGDELHLAHLLVPFSGEGTAARTAACRDALEMRAKLDSGQSLDLVASELPEESRAYDLGWIHDAALASWMAQEVLDLEPGGTTPVIETEFGCNVLQVVERRSFRRREFDDVKEQLYDELFNQRMQQEYIEFIEKLRKQTYIERKGFFADAARLGASEGQADAAGRSGP